MLKRAYGREDNKGASLVLVIISLLFVGIIAAAILRITVGNNKAVDTASRSSETFYGTENALDDLKLYLQKFANDAASKAYAAQLSTIGITGTVDKVKFDYDFKVFLKQALEGDVWNKLMAGDGTKDNVEIISLDKKSTSDGITIMIGDMAVSYRSGLTATGDDIPGEKAAITGIEVSFLDSSVNNGYKSSIYTDIVFSADMPKMGFDNTEKNFEYDADKYVIISDGTISVNNIMGQDDPSIVGSMYAKEDINISVDGAPMKVKSKYLIAGENINLLKGEVVYNGFDKALLDLKKDTSSYEAKTQDNENIWCDNLAIERGTMTVGNAKIYVKDDLSLNGDNTEFKVSSGSSSGKIVGFSSDNGNSGGLNSYDNASAIIVNGTGAKLDLSNIDSIVLAGTAYTEVPKNPGQAGNIDYFVQGESITYRTLQSMYMVDAGLLYYLDGDEEVYIGRNPMSVTEYNNWKDSKLAKIPSSIQERIADEPFLIKTVQYPIAGATKEFYYIYWNFKSVQDAVKYFYNLNDEATIAQKVKMIGSGYIKLPAEAKLDTSGNIIKYDTSSTNYFISKKNMVQGLSAAGLQECIDARLSYMNLKSSLAKDKTAGTDLFDDALFATGEIDLADISKIYDLDRPQDGWVGVDATDGKHIRYAGNCLKMTGDSYASDPTEWTYKLVTGKNIRITSTDAEGTDVTCVDPVDGVKYVIITKGNVTMDDACTFNGIIIAKGNVTINGNSTFKCFGNFYRTIKKDGETETSAYITEFEALLDVRNDDPDSANSILRRIFGLSTSGTVSSGVDTEKDIAKLTADRWKSY